MKLISCNIHNFGKLSDYERSFADGITVFLERNAWGKSTLAAFIKVMFFGFEGEGKKLLADREREKYRPWNKGIYGGSIVFEAAGKTYHLQRTFGAKEKDDTSVLYDATTNLPSSDFSCDTIGTEVFGLDEKSSLRTVFVAQNDVKVEEEGKNGVSDSINAKIGNLTDDTDDITNYESVMKEISDQMNRLTPHRATGQIRKLSMEIGDLQSEVRQAEIIENSLKDVEEKYLREKELCKQQKQKLAELSDEYAKSLMSDNYRTLKKDYEEKKEEVRLKRALFAGSIPDEEELEDMQELGRGLDREKTLMQENRLLSEDEERRKSLSHTFSAGLPGKSELEEYRSKIMLYKQTQEELAECCLGREEEERLRTLKNTYPKGVASKEEIEDLIADVSRQKTIKAELVHKKIQSEFLSGQNRQKKRLFRMLLTAAAICLLAGTALSFVSVPAAAAVFIVGIVLVIAGIVNRPAGKDDEQNRFCREVEDDEEKLRKMEEKIQLFFMDYALSGYPDTVEAVLYDMRRDALEYERLDKKKQKAYEEEKEAYANGLLEEITDYLRKFYPSMNVNGKNLTERFQLLERESIAYAELKRKKENFDKAKEAYEEADQVIGVFLKKIGQTPHPDRVKQLKDIHEQLIRYHAAYEELEKAADKMKKYEAENGELPSEEESDRQLRSRGEIAAEKEMLEGRLSETERVLKTYEKQVEELRERAQTVGEAQEKMTELSEEREELTHKYELYEKTKGYLAQAKENLTSRYRDPIMKGFEKYYAMLSGCGAKDFLMDANISLTKEEQGGRRQVTSLSSGWQDLINMCLRMALTDAMFKEEKPFLVMDDPFVNLDKEKMELAKGFLREIANEYQVLYFTCHDSRI